MEKFKALVAYISEAANLMPEQIEAFTQLGELTPKGGDYGPVYAENGEKRRQISVGYLKYDAVLKIEAYPGSGPELLALILGWLADNDPDRERNGLANPEFDAVLNGLLTSDFELKIDFEESLIVQENPNGTIFFDGLYWSLAPLEIVPAQKLVNLKGTLKTDD